MAYESDGPSSASSPLLNGAVHEQQPPTDPPKQEGHASSLAIDSGNEASIAIKVQELTNTVLDWLSHASNESLGACIVGLGASTYFVLGRIGLVLIGIVGGVVLHATWEYNGQSHEGGDARALELKRKREVGLDIVGRVLDWRQTRLEIQDEDGQATPDSMDISSKRPLDFSKIRPATGAALEHLTDRIIRDYIKYEGMSSNPEPWMLIFPGGGIALFYLTILLSLPLADRLLSAFSLHSLHTFHENGRQIHLSISLRIPLPSLSFS